MQTSYIEAIRVIYGTNTFNISTLPVLLKVPRLIPRHLFNEITSLELTMLLEDIYSFRWPSPELGRGNNSPDFGDKLVDRLCDTLPTTFPRLRKLHIAFRASRKQPLYCFETDQIQEIPWIFLGPIENIMRSMSPSQNRELSIGTESVHVWKALVKEYGGNYWDNEDFQAGRPGWFWKSLQPANDGHQTNEDGCGCGGGDDDHYGYRIYGGMTYSVAIQDLVSPGPY